MITFKGISEAVGAALVFVWALWTEFRLRQSISNNALLKRELNDEKIKAAVHSLSDSDLSNELKRDVKG